MNRLEINLAVVKFKSQQKNENMPFLVGAALAGNVVVFKELLLSPAIDVNAAGPGGVTALMIAVGLSRRSRCFFDAIIKHQDINLGQADDQGNTALHYAAILGQLYCANILLKENKQLAIYKNRRDMTPLDSLRCLVEPMRRRALRDHKKLECDIYAEVFKQMSCIFEKRNNMNELILNI